MRLTWVRSSRFPPGSRVPVLLALAWLGLVAITTWLEWWMGQDLQMCLWKRVTDYPCLTCGSGRGMVGLMKGDLSALALNPLFFLAATVILAGASLRFFARRSVNVQMSPTERGVAWTLVAIAAAVQWAYLIKTDV